MSENSFNGNGDAINIVENNNKIVFNDRDLKVDMQDDEPKLIMQSP